ARRANVRPCLRGRILRDDASRGPEGFDVMDVTLPSGATVSSHDFFIRARERLRLDVPVALNDHGAEAQRGDLDLDPSLWERVGVQATRPAAVLIPVIDRPEPQVLLTLR